MVGPTLKKIRKDKNIPIRLICDGIMDPGNYWRLENGEIDSSFSTILKLLERMNISIKEFTEELNLDESLYKSYERELVTFFKSKDVDSIKTLKQTIMHDLKNQESIKLAHLHSLADIYIFRIDKTWNAQGSKEIIKKYLAKCSNWNSYELALLNNVLFIYELDTSFLFYKTAANNYSESNTKNLIPLTLNMLALCAVNEDKVKMRYLLDILYEIKLPENNMYEITIQKWGVAIAQYYLLNETKHLQEAEETLNIFRQIGMDNTFNMYRSWTDSYIEIVNS